MKLFTLKAGAFLAVLGIGAVFSASSVAADDPAGKCGYYTNSRGNQVPSPCGNWHADSAAPSGSTARCKDGSWSWSQHPYAPGTCSRHGGVESYR